MTEYQRKQYEEAAKEYARNLVEKASGIPNDTSDVQICAKIDFKAGCEYAHSKIEEAEREILSDVFTVIENQQTLSMDDAEYKSLETVKEELKRLRK